VQLTITTTVFCLIATVVSDQLIGKCSWRAEGVGGERQRQPSVIRSVSRRFHGHARNTKIQEALQFRNPVCFFMG